MLTAEIIIIKRKTGKLASGICALSKRSALVMYVDVIEVNRSGYISFRYCQSISHYYGDIFTENVTGPHYPLVVMGPSDRIFENLSRKNNNKNLKNNKKNSDKNNNILVTLL